MWPHRTLIRAATLMLLMFPLVTAAPVPEAKMQTVSGEDPHLNNLPRTAMRDYLVELSDWIMTLDLGSNHLKGNYTPASAPTHIFINGNMARVLMATYKITGNESYINEALRWCDTLVSLQYDSETSTGKSGGYWDTGYETIYIADTGTAVTVLVLGYHMSTDAAQKASYLTALEKFSLFVTDGCKTVPTLNSTSKPLGTKCPPKGRGWVNTEGKDAGSLGDGYYEGEINLTPYTISTATLGSCTFSELTSVAAAKSWDIDFETISAGAIKWLLDSREANGVIPYIITPPHSGLVYQPITYSCESFVSNALRFPDSAVAMANRLNSTVAYMLKEQNPDGTWGVLLSGDGERSPRVVTLLQWHNSIFPTAEKVAAIEKYINYLMKPENSRAYGVRNGILQSGFVGLVIADLLQEYSTFSPATPDTTESELWVHPSSAGSLQAAVAAAATLNSATIHLHEGVHRLNQPLVLDQRHSRTRFVGHGRAIVSGGVTVGGPSSDGGKNLSSWTVVPGMSAKCAGCQGQIWKAATPKGVESRQFYVNGVRANRTWMPFPAGSTKDPQGSVISVPGADLQAFQFNQSAIELVYRGASSAGSQWQESRCPVATITKGPEQLAAGLGAMNECAADYCPKTECPQDPPTGTPINRSSCGAGVTPCICTADAPLCVGYVYNHHWGTCMPKDYMHNRTMVAVKQPCAHNGNIKVGGSQALRIPAFLENIKELLGDAVNGHPGDYYLDAQEGAVYYVPRAGETPASVVGELPTVENLVVANTVDGVSYHNVEFQHSTWMGPSGPYGFVDIQGGYTLHCNEGDPCGSGGAGGPGEARETPASLQFRGAKNVTFTDCGFSHIGSNAVAFSHGSHGNTVSYSQFRDISASAVAIGTRDNPTNKTDPSMQDLDNTVSDCTVSHAAAEFRGHPALLVGFSRGTTLEHNELSHLPYSAISLGWGWSSFPYTYGGLNNIVGNHIHHHMQVLGDGGAIYTLGAQGNLPFEMPAKYKNISAILPPSVQKDNWIHDGGNSATAKLDHEGIGEGCHCPGGLYSDEGSTNWNMTNNVVQNVLIWLQGCRPGCPWIGPNWQDYNWYDSASKSTINVQARCPLVGDQEVQSTKWPAAAQAVMNAAGPRPRQAN